MPKIAVVIPAYNAARSIGDVITRVSDYVPREDIFVVDDGSSDQTELMAREHGAWVLRHGRRKGKGVSLRDGVKKALDLDYNLLITMDSDLQHDPSEIPNFISASEKYDIVVGRRTISSDKMPFHRFMSNSITSRMISWRTGVTIADSQCGYRLYRSRVLKRIDSRAKYFEYESDMLIKAAIAGFSIGSVPVKTIYNDSKSSIRVVDILRFIKVFIKSFVIRHG
ncbi:MAG TPA: glycosyltransferase family 2 protein [Candidatus Kryptonia bacterium]